MPNEMSPLPVATGLQRFAYVTVGCFFVGMAYIGVVLPGVPATPFVLAASYCFGKSSPRLQRWLHRTPYFGGLIHDWHHHRGMRRSKKFIATILMLTAITMSIVLARLPDWVQWCIAAAGVVGLVVIWGFVKTVKRTMLDERRWHELLKRLGVQDCEGTYARLMEAYRQPHRAYHNQAHIADCLQWLDRTRYLAERPDEIELALWFHDAVYDPHSSDNEERSADWFSRDMAKAGLQANVLERIRELILSTKNHQPSASADAGLMIDIDLSVLGREPEVFDAYDRAIAAEYDWVPAEVFRRGRTAVLESFLQRPAIYRTEFFHRRFEEPARRNLNRVIKELNPPSNSSDACSSP